MLKIRLQGKFIKILAVLICILVLYFGFAAMELWRQRGDLGASFVAQQFQNAVKASTGADLLFASFSGNPFTGFVAKDVKFKLDDRTLDLAEFISIRFSLKSLITGKPSIGNITVSSAKVATDDFVKLLDLFSANDEAKRKITVDEVALNDVQIFGKRRIHIESAHLKLKSSPMAFDLRGKVDLLGLYAKGNLLITDGHAYLRDCIIQTGHGGRLSLEGEIAPSFELEGNLRNVSTDEIVAILPKFASAKPKGNISGRVKFTSNEGRLKVEGHFDVPLGEIVGIPINDASFFLVYADKVLDVKVLQDRSFDSDLAGKIVVRFNPTRLMLQLNSKEASIESWKKRFNWLSSLNGVVKDVTLSLEGPPKELSGKVAFKSSSLKALDYTLSNAEVMAEISSNAIGFKGKGIWQDMPIKLQGTTSKGDSLELNALIEAKDVDANKLKSFVKLDEAIELQGRLDVSLKLQGKPDRHDISGTVQSGNLKINGTELKDLKADFESKKDRSLVISSLRAKVYDALLNGKGSISLTSSEAVIDISGALANLDAGRIIDEGEPRISGNLTAKWQVLKKGGAMFVSAHVEAPVLKVGDLLALSDLSADLKSADDGFDISGQGSMLSGKVDFSGRMRRINKIPSVDISGRFDDVRLSSKRFPLEGSLNGPFHITGQRGKFTLSSSFASDKVEMKGIPLKGLKGQIEVDGSHMVVKSLSFGLYDGQVELAGTMQKDSLDLEGNFNAVNLAHLPLPPEWFSQGMTAGTVSIKGSLDHPQIAAKGIIREAAIDGFSFERVNFSAKSDLTNFEVEEIEAYDQGGVLRARLRGLFRPRPSFEFEIHGDNIPADLLACAFSYNLKGSFKGMTHLHLSGSYDDGLKLHGEVKAGKLSLLGIDLEDLNVPIRLSNDACQIDTLKANISGGTLQMRVNAKRSKPLRWEAAISAKNIPLEPLVCGILGNSFAAKGNATISLDLKGEGTRLVNVSGLGKMEITDGQIAGLRETNNKVLKDLGLDSFKFQRFSLDFNVNGPSFYILPGSMITSMPNDSLYRYISFDGVITTGGKIDLYCLGNINVKALNALTQALKRVATLENPSEQRVAQNLLEGFIGGYSAKDFKDISLRVNGTWPSLTLAQLRVDEPLTSKNSSPRFVDDDEDEKSIRLFFTFPTGKGKSPNYDFGDQFISQLLQGLLGQLFSPDTQANEKKGTFTTADDLKVEH